MARCGKVQPTLSEAPDGRRRRGWPDHKAAGALLALEHFSPLAFVIYGHHGGLPSLQFLKAWLLEKSESVLVQTTLRQAVVELPDLNPSKPLEAPQWLSNASKETAELFIYAVFGSGRCGFLDTEMHCCPENGSLRLAAVPGMEELETRFLQNRERVPYSSSRSEEADMPHNS